MNHSKNEQLMARKAAATPRGVGVMGTFFADRAEKGVLWTNRKFVMWRPGSSRWFRPIFNDKVPQGDEKPYPKGGTTSLLNSLRDAVQNGTRAETRGEDNIWTVAMVEAGKLSDRERRTVALPEVYANPVADPVR